MKNNNKYIKKLSLLIPFTFMILAIASLGMKSWGQVTIWAEDFEDEANNATYGNGLPRFSVEPNYDWSTNNSAFAVSNASGTKRLQASNLQGVVWSFNSDLDISAYSTVEIEMDYGGKNLDSGDDFIWIRYSVNSGGDWSLTGYYDNGFTSGVFLEEDIVGSILRLKITVDCDNGEDIWIDNIVVSGTICIPPTITPGSNPSVCMGLTSANLPYSAPTNSPTEYTIDFDATAVAAGFADVAWTTLPATPIAIVVPPAAPAATYNAVLKVRSSVACESIGYPITITVNPLPIALDLTGSKVCTGGQTSITATGWVADVTYSLFKVGDASPLYTKTMTTATYIWSGQPAGEYYVVGTHNTTGCKSTSNTVEVVINPLPVALALTGDEVCEGEITSITSSTSVIGVSYQLFDDNNEEVGSSVAGIGSGLTWTPVTAGTGYYVVGTNNQTDCKSPSNTVDVVVNSLPVALVLTGSTVCTGGQTSIRTATGLVPDVTYRLFKVGETDPVWTRTNLTFDNYTWSGQPAGEYYVVGTHNTTGCKSTSNTVEVVINLPPVISCPTDIEKVKNDIGLCGASVPFEATTTAGTTPITIAYYLNYGVAGQAKITSPHFFPVGTTTVTAVATNDCDSDECTFTVEVTDTEDPVITCPGEITVSTDPGACGANVNLNIKDKIDVLLISAESTLDEEYPDEVKQKLMATGYFNSIDLYAARLKTPANVSELENYDAVLVWSNDHFFNTIQLGNVLADYINMGGGVVLGAFAFTKNVSCPDGNFATDEYRVIVPVDFVSYTQAFLGTVNFPLHPLMKGVNSFDGGSSSYRGWSNTLTTNSYAVAKWSDELPLIAAKENVGPLGARRVDVNFYPPSSDSRSDYWNTTTDGALILANALTWVANTTESDELLVSDNCGVQSIEYFVDDVEITFPYNFPVGTTTVDVLVTDLNNNTAECDFDVVVTDDEDPEITCPTPTANYATDPGECDKELTFEFLADDNCGVKLVTYTINKLDYVLDAEPYEFTYVFQFGTTTVKGVATDIHGNVSEECSFDVVVDNVTTILEVTVDPGSQQYTDMVTLTATLTPWNCTLADCNADGEVEFTIGNQVMGKADLKGGVAELEVQLCGDFNVAGTLGTFDVSAVYTPDVCDDYLGSEDVCEDCLEIVPEVACAVYSGVYYASTGSINSTTATVVLAATVISDDDDDYCDITKVWVQFLADGRVLAQVPVTPVTEVNGELPVGEIGDGPSIGTASFEWKGVSVGTYDIRVKIVGGYYTNDTEGDCDGEAIVVVGMPSPDFITGGGYVIMENSKGLYAGTTGLKNNFGFNVKYNKKMTNLQGNINTIVRRMENDGLHIYQVKGNVMSSLTVNGNTAVFTGKANIQDITDPNNPIPIAGNCNMQFTMTDNGEPGDEDMISVTVWKSDGGMWFTTNWADNKPAEQLLDGGNLVVHSAKEEPIASEPSTPPDKKKSAEIVDTNVQFGHFAVYPNPFSERVRFEFVPSEASQARIDMLDITGRLVKTLFNQPVEAGVLYNAEFKPDGEVSSFYIYRMILGESVQTGKLIYRE